MRPSRWYVGNPTNRSCRVQRSEAYLAEIFHRAGCVRQPNAARAKRDGQTYKKGYEVRLVAGSQEELAEIRKHLREAGFKLAKPYKRATRMVQPVYGKLNMERFRAMCADWKKRQKPARKSKTARRPAAKQSLQRTTDRRRGAKR